MPCRVFQRFVEIGRVVYVCAGDDKGKIAVIVNVIDQNRALVEGPQMGVKRQAMNFKNVALTEYVIKVAPSARTGPLTKAIEKSGVLAKWADSAWAKKLAARAKRATLTDFQRFQVKAAKQKVSSNTAAYIVHVR